MKVFHFFDKDGKEMPCETAKDLIKIEEKMLDREYKRVGLDIIKIENEPTINGEYMVSTVWLGLDHNLFLKEKLIFETMIFSIKDNRVDSDDTLLTIARYSTLRQAEKGHKLTVENIKDILLNSDSYRG